MYEGDPKEIVMSIATPSPSEDPLRIIFFGRTGTGKSTTLNALFGLKRATHHAVACTTAVESVYLEFWSRPVEVIDTPGHGESRAKDQDFLPQYQQAVAAVDHVVWLLQADTRYYRPDQEMLLQLAPFIRAGTRFTIGLNRIDCLGEGDWDLHTNSPSTTQLHLLDEKCQRVTTQITKVRPLAAADVISYSAARAYGLEALRLRLIPFSKEIES
jgi:uncharacterized protein